MASGKIPSDRQAINQSHIVQPLKACAYEICKCDSKSDCSCQEPVEKIGGVTEHTSHTAMSKDTLVFPCRPTYKNVTQIASEDTQGAHCGHPTTNVTIKEVTTEDEAKELLSQMMKEKEVFIKLDWEGTKYKPPILELQIAVKSLDKKETHAITVAILTGNVIENSKVELGELFGNKQCLKVMFNPRKDFTNLLHLDIHIKKLFDIQSCVQCIHSNGPVRASAMTLDNICEKFGIKFQDSTDVSKVSVLIQLYTRLRSKDGEWFRATNQMKYMYRQKMSRIIRLTRRQREILHANCHKRNTSDHSRYVDVTHANKTQYQRDESSINRHNSVTNATVMPPNQDEINLRGNYNSNRQTLLEDGAQIQDVHNSYSPIHTARVTGNSNTHDQVMENYRRTLNKNYRRNPQHHQN